MPQLCPALCATAPFDVAAYYDRLVDPPGWPYDVFNTTDCDSVAHTSTTYDMLGRPTVVTAPNGSETAYTYDILANPGVGSYSTLRLAGVIDANDHQVAQLYNARGELVQVREYAGTGSGGDPYTDYARTTYAYHHTGNLAAVTDAGNNHTEIKYDSLGRKTWMNDPDMGEWFYRYDASGNLVAQQDAKGQVVCFVYDTLNRLAGKYHSGSLDGACPDTNSTLLATYDYYDSGVGQQGQLEEVRWPDDQHSDRFTYDSLGRRTSHRRVVDGRIYTMATSNFDALHRPATVTYPDGEVVAVIYDGAGENSLTVAGLELVSDIRFNAQGQMTDLLRPQVGIHTAYDYYGLTATGGDGNGRLKEIVHTGTAVPDFTYHYDLVGNITSIVSDDTQTFSYDALNRLRFAETLPTDPAPYDLEFRYDAVGNITQRRETVGGSPTAYNYNYSATRPHAAESMGNDSFTYDLNGNMKSREDGSETYTQDWDVENRLVQVTTSGGEATTFAYDADGLRVKTVLPDGTARYTPFPGYEEEVVWVNAPTVQIQADVATMPWNGSVVLTWQSTDADSCTAAGDWNPAIGLSGSTTVNAPVPGGWALGPHLFTITCTNAAGSVSAAVTVNVPAPALQLTASPATTEMKTAVLAVLPFDEVTISWSSQYASQCAAAAPWTASTATSGGETLSAPPGGWPLGDTTFSMTCTNGRGDATTEAVNVTVLQPSVTLYQASTDRLLTHGAVLPGDNVSLGWYSTGVDSCTATEIEGTTWDGSRAVDGNEVIAPPEGGWPLGSVFFTLACDNGRDATSDVLEITIPRPEVTLSESGWSSEEVTNHIFPDDPIPLWWSSRYALACQADSTPTSSWHGSQAVSGSAAVPAPTGSWVIGNNQFTLTCDNGRDTGMDMATVTVLDPLPCCRWRRPPNRSRGVDRNRKRWK